MANEITLSASVTVAKGIDRLTASFSKQFTQTGADANVYTLTVTDAGWTALGKASIGDLGVMVIHNLSETTGDIVYVTRNGGTTEHEELLPGAWLLTWLRSSATIADVGIKAATGKTVLVKVYLAEK
jgi:hypothetical protein